MCWAGVVVSDMIVISFSVPITSFVLAYFLLYEETSQATDVTGGSPLIVSKEECN